MDPALAIVPFLRLYTESFSPKPQGLKWGQPDPAKDDRGALPGKKGDGCWQAKTAMPTRGHFYRNGLRPLLRVWPPSLPLRLCPSGYLACTERHARLWVGHWGDRAERDAVCILEELGKEKHTCAGELTLGLSTGRRWKQGLW